MFLKRGHRKYFIILIGLVYFFLNYYNFRSVSLEKTTQLETLKTTTQAIANLTGTYVVLSIDLDTSLDYQLFYLPIVCLSWRLVNFEPIVIAIISNRTEINKLAMKTIEYLDLLRIKIVSIQSVESYEKMIAILSRLFVGLLDEPEIRDDHFIFQTDCDLLPINKQFYESFDKGESIKIFQVSSSEKPTENFIYNDKNYHMYARNHLGMMKWQWKELMNFDKLTLRLEASSILQLGKEYYEDSLIKKNDQFLKGGMSLDMDLYILSINMADYLKKANHKLSVKISSGIKLNRLWSEEKWRKTFESKFDSINEIQLFNENYLDKLNLINMIVNKLFSNEEKKLINTCINEFVKMKKKN